MATKSQIDTFISQIKPFIERELLVRGYNVNVENAIIAQACLESSYGTCSLSEYHNYFGMKCGKYWTGRSVNKTTHEEYKPGESTKISALFRAYDTMEAGIVGYFDFINTKRYENLKTATTPLEYLNYIKADGYATSNSYVTNCIKVIDKYLTSNTTPDTEYYDKYIGTSTMIDKVFSSINVEFKYRGSWTCRRPVAIKNGITDYTGKMNQNLKLIQLAKNGQLKRP